MSEPAPEPPPPLRFGFGGALAFTGAAWFASIFVASLLFGWASPPTALAFGAVAGFGGIGTLLARRLPAPVEARLGLRGFAPRWLPALLLLVPAALLASELDNWVKALAPLLDAAGGEAPLAPEAVPEAAGPEVRPEAGAEALPETAPGAEAELSPWLLFEAVIGMVLLRPVVEEFFFRGLLLHGLVERYGAALGILAAATLSAIAESAFALPVGGVVAISALVQGLFLGVMLGTVRLASRSLLAAIALLAALRGFGGLAVYVVDAIPIPGFNAPGDHTPAAWLLPALLCVALGAWHVARLASSEPEPSEAPEREIDRS